MPDGRPSAQNTDIYQLKFSQSEDVYTLTQQRKGPNDVIKDFRERASKSVDVNKESLSLCIFIEC